MAQTIRDGIAWAGFAAGPAAWAISFELNYSITHWQCLAHARPAPLVSAGAIAVALAGAGLSWRAYRTASHGVAPPLTARTRRFLAGTSLGMALLFALAMALQLVAGLIFGGCEL
ncbi:MAG: hypothetical protein ACTHJ3_14920 [Pararhizobium sp.]